MNRVIHFYAMAQYVIRGLLRKFDVWVGVLDPGEHWISCGTYVRVRVRYACACFIHVLVHGWNHESVDWFVFIGINRFSHVSWTTIVMSFIVQPIDGDEYLVVMFFYWISPPTSGPVLYPIFNWTGKFCESDHHDFVVFDSWVSSS
jgi:hypothetical protein